jgi:hypothetical protein
MDLRLWIRLVKIDFLEEHNAVRNSLGLFAQSNVLNVVITRVLIVDSCR